MSDTTAIPEAITKARYIATTRLANRTVASDAQVLEIGSTDASFRSGIRHGQWSTVDKYGTPDMIADLDGLGARIPLPDRSLDAVVCTEVLEHLSAGTTLVREMARVLKRDGVAIVSVPNMVSAKARAYFAIGRMPSMAAAGDCGVELGGTGILTDEGWVAGHVVDFNERRLNAYLRRGGLQVVDRQTLPFYLGRPPKDRILFPWMPRRLADYLVVAARPVG